MERKSLKQRRKQMRRRQMMQKVSRISLCVVIGLLFLALIWKFAGAQLAKKGIVLSNDTAAKTVSETAPEAEDGSGNALHIRQGKNGILFRWLFQAALCPQKECMALYSMHTYCEISSVYWPTPFPPE